jgi:hypothetical protein
MLIFTAIDYFRSGYNISWDLAAWPGLLASGTLRREYVDNVALFRRGNVFLFSVVFTPPLPCHHGGVWLLSAISLLLTNTVSPPARAAYPYDWRGFVKAKKKTIVGLSIFSSTLYSLLLPDIPSISFLHVQKY